ncbi:hypothetical protein BDB01DRAFT_796700 [Pilobolus umbonatus]|nr:hypothetical protein BDB01DRAFT_796700 [Pilobolus umbonatus]
MIPQDQNENPRYLTARKIDEVVDKSIDRNHIDSVYNVQPDGNCGFRAVALHLKNDEDKWKEVRKK